MNMLRSIRSHSYFNPATVWFEHQVATSTSPTDVDFNPATVWFELNRVQDDLISKLYISIPQRSDLNNSAFAHAPITLPISIPQRSDLNQARHRQIHACLQHRRHN